MLKLAMFLMWKRREKENFKSNVDLIYSAQASYELSQNQNKTLYYQCYIKRDPGLIFEGHPSDLAHGSCPNF